MSEDIEIEVGERVCLVRCGINSGRQKTEDGYAHYRYGVITKVGRKFFFVTPEDSSREYKFFKEGLKEDRGGYCQDHFLYKTFEDYKSEVDASRALSKLKKDYFDTFNDLKLTLDQIERIRAIIEEDNQ